MPIYEFQCKQCGHKFDISLSIKSRENAVIICPECQSMDNEQLFNGISFNVKGSVSSPPMGSPFSGGCCGGGGCG